jgi:hypothetical protein
LNVEKWFIGTIFQSKAAQTMQSVVTVILISRNLTRSAKYLAFSAKIGLLPGCYHSQV